MHSALNIAHDSESLLLSGVARVQPLRDSNALQWINRLPEELLVKIFGLCTPSYILGASELDECPMVEIIAAVCDMWRFVALENTSLWRKITYRYHALEYQSVRQSSIDRLRTFLRRSGSSALDITFAVDIPLLSTPSSFPNEPSYAWDFIAVELHRCRRLTLSLSRVPFHTFFPLAPSLPILEEVDIYVDPHRSSIPIGGTKIQIILSQEIMPRLRVLKFSQHLRHIARFFLVTSFDPTYIHTLSLDIFGTRSNVVPLIQSCQCIRILILRGFSVGSAGSLQLDIPSLESLSILSGSVSSLLPLISAPKLRHFNYSPSTKSFWRSSQESYALNLFKRPIQFPALRTLTICPCSSLGDPIILTAYIKEHRELVGLQVPLVAQTPAFFRHMAAEAMHFPPSFRILRISGADGLPLGVEQAFETDLYAAARHPLRRFPELRVIWPRLGWLPHLLEPVAASYPERWFFEELSPTLTLEDIVCGPS